MSRGEFICAAALGGEDYSYLKLEQRLSVKGETVSIVLRIRQTGAESKHALQL